MPQRPVQPVQLVASPTRAPLPSIYRANGFNDANVTATVKDLDTGVSGAKEVEGCGYLRCVQDRRRRAADLWRGQSQRHRSVATQGHPGTAAGAERPALLAHHAFGRPRCHPRVLPQQRFRSSHGSRSIPGPSIAHDKARDRRRPTTSPKVQQVFVGKVLESPAFVHTTPGGRSTIRCSRCTRASPLDQSALLETQRNLYNLALFNEVVAAVQNPAGDAEQKNVLVQVTEAKRWDVTYGFGFEAQTGVPRPAGTIAPSRERPRRRKARRASVRACSARCQPHQPLRGTDDTLTLHTQPTACSRTVATADFPEPPPLREQQVRSARSPAATPTCRTSPPSPSSKLQGDSSRHPPSHQERHLRL